jgi:hypothetical protein
MKVAFGLKAHSGWAALVVIGGTNRIEIVDRRRLELVDQGEEGWAKQPYHAAEHLAPPAARRLVQRGIDAAHRNATRAMREAVARAEREGHSVSGCAVLMGKPMPAWTVDEILAVHFRMHKAEGELFRGALVDGARRCGLVVVTLTEKERARRAKHLGDALATLGKSAGPPWGRDQKDAALAAWIALG